MVRKLTTALGVVASFTVGVIVGAFALAWMLIIESTEEELEQFLSTEWQDVFVSIRPELDEEELTEVEPFDQDQQSE